MFDTSAAFVTPSEPIRRGLVADSIWFLQNPHRRYRLRAVPPAESAEMDGRGWSLAARWRTTADGLEIQRKIYRCSRRDARSVERDPPDEALSRDVYCANTQTRTDAFDGFGILSDSLPTGGMQ